MSKLNIDGIITNIRSKTNVYTPIIEAVVNSIDAVIEAESADGEISIVVKRTKTLEFDDTLPYITSIEIRDNGVGFNQKNRDSFDTFYSDNKKDKGGKGFGRFMFLKYFNDVKVVSTFKEEEIFKTRKFVFGKKDVIIDKEAIEDAADQNVGTLLYLNNVLKDNLLDKELDTIARKLVEKLLIFFINANFNCPKIILKEEDDSSQIILNDYLAKDSEIQLKTTSSFTLKAQNSSKEQTFTVKIFKVYFAGNQKSKISLTAHNREVSETTLQTYVPEFEDDFFDELDRGDSTVRKNYIIKTYVLGDYLNENVSLERETFNFSKDKPDAIFDFSQADIEKKAAEVTRDYFNDDVKVRADKKRTKIVDYITTKAPWHRAYINDIDFASMPYVLNDEKIELALQTIKFHKEQESKAEIKDILESENADFEEKLGKVMAKITEVGKNDLAHYVCTRKVVLQIFEDLLRRDIDGKANLEKEVHNIIFPMGKDTQTINYEDHNLWLLDERLVFSEYIASDRKISKQKDALGEPDLIIFDQKKSFRSGDNEFSNPLTIFEFKRPKRENYKQEDDPILQVGQYLDKIRQGKYELPDGLEKIKVNDNTPVYGYIVCDLTDKIKEFARLHQLTLSPDNEGYFGYHSGYKIYIEMFSFKKLLKDANLRNKIFFRKLHIE